MDFCTNHFAVVFYFVWFIVGKVCSKYYVFADEMYFIAFVLSCVNAVLGIGIHARQTRKGCVYAHILNIVLILSFLTMYTIDLTPTFSMVIVCLLAGMYFAFDADFYYGSDIIMYWMYGWYLLCAANKGTSMLLGVVSASIVVVLGWLIGQKNDGIDSSLGDLCVDIENLGFSLVIAGLQSACPLVLYSGATFGLNGREIRIPLNFNKSFILLGSLVILAVYVLVVGCLAWKIHVEDGDNRKCHTLVDSIREELRKLAETSWIPPDGNWIQETYRQALCMMFGDDNQLISRLEKGKELAVRSPLAVEIFERCLCMARQLDAVPNKVM